MGFSGGPGRLRDLFVYLSPDGHILSTGGERMPKEELKKLPAGPHGLQLEGREKLSVRGVEDVSGFDESTVLLRTSAGELCIRGQELHIERIDLDAGQLELRGKIQELSYDEPAQGGFFSRLFG